MAVDDLVTVRGWYARALGTAGDDLACPELGAAGARFAIGPHTFEFLAPTGAGAIRAWLAARGPSPYAATLVGAPASRPAGPRSDLGARLALAETKETER